MTLQQNRAMNQGAALVLLAGAIVVVAALLWPLIEHITNTSAQLEADRENLSRLQTYKARALARKPDAGAAEDILSSPLFIHGANDALRAARLQQTVTGIMKAKGITLRTTRPIDLPPIAGFRRLCVEFELTAPIKDLRDFLVEVKAHSAALSLASLKLAAAYPNDPQRRDVVDARVGIAGVVAD